MAVTSARPAHAAAVAARIGASARAVALAELIESSDVVVECATAAVANGVVPGLDMLRAAAEGTIESVRLTSRLRPASIAAEPYLVERGVALPGAGEPATQIFDGTGRGVALAFPRHFNFAAPTSADPVGAAVAAAGPVCRPGGGDPS